MSKNKTLSAAKSAKNDEFYTQYADIQKENKAYSYDALNRPVNRNADTFGYNDRSEVTAANVSGVPAAYGYDEIGNSTNWTANRVNQYTEFTHDADGNLLTDCVLSFTYDAANRLKTASSNGVLLPTPLLYKILRRRNRSLLLRLPLLPSSPHALAEP